MRAAAKVALTVKKGKNYLFLLFPILLLAIGVGVWDFLQTESNSIGIESGNASPEAAKSSDPLENLENALPLESAAESVVQRQALAQGSAPSSVDKSSWVEVSVLVISGDPSSPVPFATGFLLPLNRPYFQAMQRSRFQGVDSWRLAEESGIAFTTNEEGLAIVKAPPGPILGVAKRKELYAEKWGDTHQGNVILALKEDLGFRVRVVNERGELLPGFPLGLTLSRDDYVDQKAVFFSDEDGIVSLKHLQTYLYYGKVRPRLVLRAAAPFRDPPEIEIETDSVPTGVLDYLVPHHGSVRIHLRDSQGRPPKNPIGVVLQREYSGRDAWEEFLGFQTRYDLGALEKSSQDGEVFFPYTGLGLSLEVAASLRQDDKPIRVVFDSPNTLGEEVSLTINAGEAAPLIRFRAVDENGAPFLNASLSLQGYFERGLPGKESMAVLVTDAAGIAEYSLPSEMSQGGAQALSFDIEVQKSSPLLKGKIRLDGPLPQGALDLGDQVFAADPIACSGIVVSEDGAPVKGVLIRMQYDEKVFWRRSERQSTRSQGDGSFEIRGLNFGQPMALSARHRLYPAVSMPIAYGTEGLVVEMKTGYELKGKVLADDGIDLSKTRLIAAPSPIPEHAQGEIWSWPRLNPQSSGGFRILLSSAEPRTLVIVDAQSEAILAIMESVIPKAPGSDSDDRLARWDLGGKIYPFTVNFENEGGQPVSQVNLVLDNLGSLGYAEYAQADLWRGSGNLLLPVSQVRFKATAPDTRTLHGQMESGGEANFVLRRGIPAEVHMTPAGFRGKGWRVRLNLEPVQEGLVIPPVWNVPLDDEGVFHFAFPEEGEFRVSISVETQRPENGFKTVKRLFPEPDLRPLWVVSEQEAVHKFELTVDQVEIEAFLEKH